MLYSVKKQEQVHITSIALVPPNIHRKSQSGPNLVLPSEECGGMSVREAVTPFENTISLNNIPAMLHTGYTTTASSESVQG